MTETALFSVIILSYKSGKTWRDAVGSVLLQNYPRIELIFSDDGSDDFCKEEIEAFILSNCRPNLIKYDIYSSSENRGTVANICSAQAKCSGKFVMHFAADDALADDNCLTVLSEALMNKPYEVLGVYGQSIVCDEKLNSLGKCSFDTEIALKMNNETAHQQWKRLCTRCCIHLGATAFVKEELFSAVRFDEKFELIEDWPFFLVNMQNGKRFQFMNAPILLYRQGGVTNTSPFNKERKRLFKDHLSVYEKYILPFTEELDNKNALKVWLRYLDDRKDASQMLDVFSAVPYAKLFSGRKKERIFFLVWLLKRYRKYFLAVVVVIALLIIMLRY